MNSNFVPLGQSFHGPLSTPGGLLLPPGGQSTMVIGPPPGIQPPAGIHLNSTVPDGSQQQPPAPMPMPLPLPPPGAVPAGPPAIGKLTINERVAKAQAKLADNEYDIEAWNVLIKDAQLKRVDEARPFFDKLVSVFPNCGRFWKTYIEHEMKSRNFEKVEKLFQRCLIKVLHIDLWRCYLNYIKETKGALNGFREKMAQAYDFALDKIGIDINSYGIWNDYVKFLKNVDAAGSYAENQKITAVRRVYQRGVVNPMVNIEMFWKDYIAYEQSINQMIAEKMITDRSREYMNARRVAKEFEAVARGLNRNAPAVPPQNTAEEAKQVELWRKYIQWEKSNPLRTEDQSLVIKRVTFAYEQCLLCLGHHPNIWYEFASYLDENSKLMAEKGDVNQFKTLQEETSSVYERATSGLLKNNLLINLAYADFEEARNRKDEAGKIYERLIDPQNQDVDPTLAYIQFMKFKRRTDSIKAARYVFKRAREDARTGHQMYTAAAKMEYYCSKETTVACKIFELGLKKFADSQEFVMAYIDFLSNQNEENNTRVLFERVLTSGSLPPEKSLEIWNKYLEFESQIGDLSSVVKIERRRAQAFEKLSKSPPETAWLVDRYKFLDLLPCGPTELRCIGYSMKHPTADGGLSSGLMSVGGTHHHHHHQLVSTTTGHSHQSSSAGFPKPDFNQMLPYKPKFSPLPGAHSVPGGIFPPPPAVGALLAQLPHPASFRGPFVGADELMNLFRMSHLNPPKPDGVSHGDLKGKNLFEMVNDGGVLVKRPLADDDEEADGDGSNLAPPQFDIYRSRQLQKRTKT